MIDPTFVSSLVLVCGFAGVTSIAGLILVRSTPELFHSSQPSFSLVDLFALGAIQVASVGYMWSAFPNGDDAKHLAFALGAGCVATFWWFVISTRLKLPGIASLARGVYLCFFVLAAFLCPFVAAVSVVEIILPFDERPGMEYEADVVRATLASTLYATCFPLNRWLGRVTAKDTESNHPNRSVRD